MAKINVNQTKSAHQTLVTQQVIGTSKKNSPPGSTAVVVKLTTLQIDAMTANHVSDNRTPETAAHLVMRGVVADHGSHAVQVLPRRQAVVHVGQVDRFIHTRKRRADLGA